MEIYLWQLAPKLSVIPKSLNLSTRRPLDGKPKRPNKTLLGSFASGLEFQVVVCTTMYEYYACKRCQKKSRRKFGFIFSLDRISDMLIWKEISAFVAPFNLGWAELAQAKTCKRLFVFIWRKRPFILDNDRLYTHSMPNRPCFVSWT